MDHYKRLVVDTQTSGIISDPVDGRRFSDSILIITPGLGSHKDKDHYLDIEQTLNDNYISTFRFDLHGHGDRYGIENPSNITLDHTINQVIESYSTLQSLGYKNIGIYGNCYGASASIVAAAHCIKPSFLILKSPFTKHEHLDNLAKGIGLSSTEEWKNYGSLSFPLQLKDKETSFMLPYTFKENCAQYDFMHHAKQLNIPTLILHGKHDQFINYEDSKALSSHMKNTYVQPLMMGHHINGQSKELSEHIRNHIIKNTSL